MITKRFSSRSGESSSALSAWPLRRKVALALAIPLLLAGTLGGLRVQSDLVEASNSSSSAQQVTALRPAVDYLTAAEEAMVAAVGAEGGSRAALERALGEVRTAGDALLESKETADLTDEQRYQVDAVLDLSQALRGEDAATLSPGTWVAQLRQLQSGVTQLITTIVNEQINPEPRLELLSQTLAGRFSLAMQQALVATERTGETASLELFSELGVEGAAIDRLASALGTSEEAVASLRTANAERFREVRTGGTNLGGPAAYADYDSIISTLQDGIDAELEAAAAEARADAVMNAVVTLAALVAAIMLALLISRMLLDPIRRVREGALSVAHERLPEAVARIRAGEEPGEITPIDVTTQEEIGQLARAVDDMHRQAVVLASGEANLRSQVSQMFVTLSRRSTSLINQQLGLIERLERDEEDPKRLESLFRLDHLAARMRRTADSLLILADAPSANAVVDGLTVSDALQAATSGVQDYQRVRIRSANPMRIAESAAADVVHLLTELVDNALTYSPPTSAVTVGSTTTPQGVVIEIADAGLGIPAEQLAKINESLASGGEVTPDTARRMGLFVVSRLSQRHGIATSLRTNDEGGTTASVTLPVAILPELAPPAPAKRPTAPAPRPVTKTAAPRPVATPVQTRTPATAGDGGRRPDHTPVRSERKPEKNDRKNDRKPEPANARADEHAPMDVEDRINAALGLPTRRPGGTLGAPSAAPAPVTPSTASAALAALRPLRDGVPEGSPNGTAPNGTAPNGSGSNGSGSNGSTSAGIGSAGTASDAAKATEPAPSAPKPAADEAPEPQAPAPQGPAEQQPVRAAEPAPLADLPTRRRRRRAAAKAARAERAAAAARASGAQRPGSVPAAEAEPVKAEPVTSESVKAEPVKAESAKAEPVKAEPLKAPVKAQQVAQTAPAAKADPGAKAEPAVAPKDAPPLGAETGPEAGPVTEPRPTAEPTPTAAKDAPAAKADPVGAPVPAAEPVPDPMPKAPATSPANALDGDWTDPGSDGFDTPIFRSLRSAWLTSGDDAQPWRTSEIEAGWEMVEELAETPAEPEVSASGLPVRRPGQRLVPGGVTAKPTATVRDPEAVRARLAAHASGVSRGRAAATTAPAPAPEQS